MHFEITSKVLIYSFMDFKFLEDFSRNVFDTHEKQLPHKLLAGDSFFSYNINDIFE